MRNKAENDFRGRNTECTKINKHLAFFKSHEDDWEEDVLVNRYKDIAKSFTPFQSYKQSHTHRYKSPVRCHTDNEVIEGKVCDKLTFVAVRH